MTHLDMGISEAGS